MNSTEIITNEWYRDYYQKKGKDRNDLLVNSEVLFQNLAFEVSVISALREMVILDREVVKILDVGCAGGGSLLRFLQLGFFGKNLHGIDIVKDRINEANINFPNLNFICGDATNLPYDTNMFDLVLESTMFVQITNEDISNQISKEMLRVTKPKGYIMLIDWRYGKPNDPNYLAVSTKRIKKMFKVGSQSRIVCQTDGALIPPIGRKISKYFPSTYFLLKNIFPFLTGQKTTLLQKS